MKPNTYRLKANAFAAALLVAAMLALPFAGTAQTFIVSNTVSDAFVASGSAGNPAGTDLTTNNYGGAGQLAIASSSSTKGEFDSLIMFNTANAVSAFNLNYGVGNWTITGLTLSLASNTGTQGAAPGNTIFNSVNAGVFQINWLLNDSWVEGTGTPAAPTNNGVTFNSVSTLLAGSDALGSYTFTPPGNNLYANYNLLLDGNLVADAAAGGNVSLYFYATNGAVSYVFNSRSGPAPHPELTINVAVTPEPGTVSLMVMALGGIMWCRVSRREKQRQMRTR